MADERVRLRRSDRAMPEESQIEALLGKAPVGYIATSADDQPYIIPNLFWYNQSSRQLYFHTALEGRTRSNVERNPRVCFCVSELGQLLPASTAEEFSAEYASVCVFGSARLVEGQEEKRYGLQGLLDKYFPQLIPGKDYRPITEDEMSRTAVFAIQVEAWSGKQTGTT